MDAYNLAICFGPTLMPAPEDKDQVQFQNQVNELIKNLIVFHEDLFPKDLGGTLYEKYISQEPFDCDVGDSPTEQISEDPDSEVYPSEDGKFDVIFITTLFFICASYVLHMCLSDNKILEETFTKKKIIKHIEQRLPKSCLLLTHSEKHICVCHKTMVRLIFN